MGSISSRRRTRLWWRPLLILSLALLCCLLCARHVRRRPKAQHRSQHRSQHRPRNPPQQCPQSRPQTPPRRVLVHPATQVFPAVDGRNVVWQDERSGPADIFLADLDTGAIRNLTNSPEWEAEPDISGALCRLA